MNRYFYDWEFQEQQDPHTGLTTIYPISLGMVSDDNRELYLVNNSYLEWEFAGVVKTSDWVNKNVLSYISEEDRDAYGMPFISFQPYVQDFISHAGEINDRRYVELWGYFGAYDHVSLAQVFGSMLQLPQPIPMYTNDLMTLVTKRIPFKPEDEHHALSDARWNKLVWEWLQ